ncbi:S-protein homolog 7-like [Juglans regia]|uniref:S-protein homolog n=1 Tax=Juglans regia TaxID=51240 RepID=A0A2I4HKW5_JUGRE|nr:S-protein homolog 7-like [Juglans regia]
MEMKRMGMAKLYCFALVLVFAFGLSSSSRVPRERKHYVKFINNLSNKVLNVNCKNEKPYIDLTLHILLPKEEYEFNYIVGRGMAFRCDLRHGSTSKAFLVSDRAIKRECGRNHCIWKAQDDGVYLLNRKTNQYTFKFGWEN